MYPKLLIKNQFSDSDNSALNVALRLVETTLYDKTITLRPNERSNYALNANQKLVIIQSCNSSKIAASVILESFINRLTTIIEKLEDTKAIYDNGLYQDVLANLQQANTINTYQQNMVNNEQLPN